MLELIFTNAPVSNDCGYVGGPCKLPVQILWPHDTENNPLYHLISVPVQWLGENRFSQITTERWLSIFIPYDKENFSHYSKMSPDELDIIDAIVILHDMSGIERSEHPAQETKSGSVKTAPVDQGRDLNDIASYIGGSPTWVQDPIQLENYAWIMSLYGPDLDQALLDNPGILSDGVGYLFLPDNFDVDNFGQIGRFYFQF